MDTKTVTIALERHEELIRAEERLAVIKTITNQPHPYDHDKIRLIQAILEDKQMASQERAYLEPPCPPPDLVQCEVREYLLGSEK